MRMAIIAFLIFICSLTEAAALRVTGTFETKETTSLRTNEETLIKTIEASKDGSTDIVRADIIFKNTTEGLIYFETLDLLKIDGTYSYHICNHTEAGEAVNKPCSNVMTRTIKKAIETIKIQ